MNLSDLERLFDKKPRVINETRILLRLRTGLFQEVKKARYTLQRKLKKDVSLNAALNYFILKGVKTK